LKEKIIIIFTLPAAPAICLWKKSQFWRENDEFGAKNPDLAEKIKT